MFHQNMGETRKGKSGSFIPERDKGHLPTIRQASRALEGLPKMMNLVEH
jgi:hypothetical protein